MISFLRNHICNDGDKRLDEFILDITDLNV